MSLSSFNEDFWKLINKKTQRSWYAISSSWNEDMRGAWSSCAVHDDQSDWVVVCGVSCVQLYCLLAGDLPPSTHRHESWSGSRQWYTVFHSQPRHTDGPLSSLLHPAHFRWDITLRSLTTCQSVRAGWGFPSLKLSSSDRTYLAGRRLDWINSGMRNEGG